jgi:hypothetical protein
LFSSNKIDKNGVKIVNRIDIYKFLNFYKIRQNC